MAVSSQNPEMTAPTNPWSSIIAGFIVEYGSSQIDLSVKGQLDRITSELTTAKMA